MCADSRNSSLSFLKRFMDFHILTFAGVYDNLCLETAFKIQ